MESTFWSILLYINILWWGLSLISVILAELNNYLDKVYNKFMSPYRK
jgi:hypothetical protein